MYKHTDGITIHEKTLYRDKSVDIFVMLYSVNKVPPGGTFFVFP